MSLAEALLKVGILGIDVDSRIAQMLPGIRLSSGVIVVQIKRDGKLMFVDFQLD